MTEVTPKCFATRCIQKGQHSVFMCGDVIGYLCPRHAIIAAEVLNDKEDNEKTEL